MGDAGKIMDTCRRTCSGGNIVGVIPHHGFHSGCCEGGGQLRAVKALCCGVLMRGSCAARVGGVHAEFRSSDHMIELLSNRTSVR